MGGTKLPFNSFLKGRLSEKKKEFIYIKKGIDLILKCFLITFQYIKLLIYSRILSIFYSPVFGKFKR